MLWAALIALFLQVELPELAEMMTNTHTSDKGHATETNVTFRREDDKGLMMILEVKYGDGGEQAAMEERRIIYVGAITQASVFGGSGESDKQDVRVLVKHSKLEGKGPLNYRNEQADFGSVEALLIGTYTLDTARKIAAELVHLSMVEQKQSEKPSP